MTQRQGSVTGGLGEPASLKLLFFLQLGLPASGRHWAVGRLTVVDVGLGCAMSMFRGLEEMKTHRRSWGLGNRELKVSARYSGRIGRRLWTGPAAGAVAKLVS